MRLLTEDTVIHLPSSELLRRQLLRRQTEARNQPCEPRALLVALEQLLQSGEIRVGNLLDNYPDTQKATAWTVLSEIDAICLGEFSYAA